MGWLVPNGYLLARASDFDPGGGFPYPAPCFCSSFFKAASCFLTTTVRLSSSPTTSLSCFFLAAKRTLPALTAPGFISHEVVEAHWLAWRQEAYIISGSSIVSTFLLHCVTSIHSSFQYSATSKQQNWSMMAVCKCLAIEGSPAKICKSRSL